MTYKEIAELIQNKYGFINKPSREEIDNILGKVTQETTENEFDEIVFQYIKNTLAYANESLDMSSSISILEQIKKVLSEQ